MAMEAETGVWLQAQDIGGRPPPAGTPRPAPAPAEGAAPWLWPSILMVCFWSPQVREHISTISRHPVCGFVPGTTNPVKERKAP